jgi:cytochrome b561
MSKGARAYSTLSKLLHWLIAILVMGLLSISFFLDNFPEKSQAMAYMMHKSIGLTVLGLMLIRVLWLVYHGRPKLPSRMPRWQRYLAYSVQWGLYALLIAMPLCGWVMSMASGHTPIYMGVVSLPLPGIHVNKALSDIMLQCHQTIAWVLIALIALHIAGAFKHQWIDRDRVVRRMWFR